MAALLVTAYHAAGNLAKDTYFGPSADALSSLFHFGGAAGVAFFFVLSGFIVTHVHWQDMGQPTTLPDYLRKRLVRVYPPYIAVFLAVYVAAWLTPSLRHTLPDDPGEVLRALLLIPQDPVKVGGLGAPVIIVAWSLHFEMVFYLVFALALIDVRLFAGAVVVWTGWGTYGQWVGLTQFPATFFSNSIALLFLFGMASATLLHHGPRLARPGWLAAAGGIGFLGACVLNEANSAPHSLWQHIAYGITGGLCVFGLTRFEQGRTATPPPGWLMRLGDASYALYLIHFPLIAVLSKLAVRLPWRGPAAASVTFVIMIAVCAAVAMAFHRWVERPMLRWLRPRGPAGA